MALERIGDRFVSCTVIGTGQFTVYKCWDLLLSRDVAIKRLVVPGKQRGDSGEESAADPRAAILQRYLEEGLRLAQVKHDNVVMVHDVKREADAVNLVMEYVEGVDLEAAIRDQAVKLTFAEKLRVMRQILAGLHAAHRLNIVHRDIKPANIRLQLRPRKVKIVDFGIATQIQVDRNETNVVNYSGSTAYCAPEQHEGKADKRSDIYSAGVVFYELLAERRLFQGGLGTIVVQKRDKAVPPIGKLPAGYEWVERVVRKCLEPEPDQRFQSCVDVLRALKRGRDGRFGGTRIAIAIAAVVLVAALGGRLWRAKESIPESKRTPEPAGTAPASPVSSESSAPPTTITLDPVVVPRPQSGAARQADKKKPHPPVAPKSPEVEIVVPPPAPPPPASSAPIQLFPYHLAVKHDHRVGSCDGVLILYPERIEYTKHHAVWSIAALGKLVLSGKSLALKYNKAPYNFELAAPPDPLVQEYFEQRKKTGDDKKE